MEDYYLEQAKGIAFSLVKVGLVQSHNTIKTEALLLVALEERFSSEKVIQHLVGIADLSIEKVFEHLNIDNSTLETV